MLDKHTGKFWGKCAWSVLRKPPFGFVSIRISKFHLSFQVSKLILEFHDFYQWSTGHNFLIAPKALYFWLPNTHEVSEKRCPPGYARYAVLGSGRGMSTSRIDPRKILGGVSTLRGIHKNMSGSAPGVGQPGPFPCAETAKWTILRPSENSKFSNKKSALRKTEKNQIKI